MDRDGCHVLRGCRRISDLEIALGSLNSNCSSNAGRPRRSGRDHSSSYRNSLEHAELMKSEASTRWAGGVEPSMMPEAVALDPADETCREYERVVDPKYLEEIRARAKEFSTKRLARRSRLGECTIRNFKNGKGNIRPGSLRKLMVAIHDLQNKIMKN